MKKTPITLNTEDESPEIPADTISAQDRTNGIYRAKDRYIADDMTSWTQVYRFGHMLLVPTRLMPPSRCCSWLTPELLPTC